MSDADESHKFVYTGPGTIGGKYMRSFWQPVFVADQLKPGKAKPLRIMSEDFTLYRAEDGRPQVLAPNCPHRGTRLSTGWVEGEAIRCFYHGWKFGPGGQCLEAPAETSGLAAITRIRSYPTREYNGLIFAYLGEGEPPMFPEYAVLEEEGTIRGTLYRRDCNYFNSVENGGDPVHVAFTHRVSSFTEGGLIGVPKVSAEETAWGVAISATREGGSTRVTQIGMPNMLHLTAIPDASGEGVWADVFAWRVPVDDESHLAFNIWLIREKSGRHAEASKKAASEPLASMTLQEIGAAFRRGDLDHEDIKGHPEEVFIQDDIIQIGQGAIADRANERLGRSDIGVVLIRRLWLRELRALEAGAPLKDWQWNPSLAVSVGASETA